jgi:DNA-binding response OmpR family regulator
MGRILILEEDFCRALLLKNALKTEGYQVVVMDGRGNVSRIRSQEAVDLILVSRFLQNDSGWEVYNRLREEDGTVPVMLYALSGASRIAINWVIKAVNEGLKCSEENRLQRAVAGYA